MKIHVYGQHTAHDRVFLVGDKEGFRALRNACEEAIDEGASSKLVEAADGEAYNVIAVCLPEFNLKWDQLSFPYADHDVTGTGGPLQPSELLAKDQYLALLVEAEEYYQKHCKGTK